jgi:phage-related baseplate assembly protein
LRTYLREINVLTDDIEVLDGELKPVDFSATIVVSRNADAATIKEQANAAIDSFFSLVNWNMGQALYVSNLYDVLMRIEGVRNVTIYKPEDDLLSERDITISMGSSADNIVKFNELIIMGNKELKIYYEK